MQELSSDLAPGGLVVSCEVDGCDAELATYGGRLTHHEDGSHTFTYGEAVEIVTYVGWGGITRSVNTDIDLGRGRVRTPDHGIRRAIWDAAFSYVSGFRRRDIAYYLLTRSFSARVADRVIRAEQRRRGE